MSLAINCMYVGMGLTENDGHENDGPNFRTFARHEIAGHEIAGQWKCTDKNAVLTEMTLLYNEGHKCLLLVYPLDTNTPMHCVYVTMYVEKS